MTYRRKWQTCNISCNWTKTVNYSLPSNFVDFALSDVTLHWKKLEGWLGAWTSFYKTQTLWKSNLHQNDCSIESVLLSAGQPCYWLVVVILSCFTHSWLLIGAFEACRLANSFLGVHKYAWPTALDHPSSWIQLEWPANLERCWWWVHQ